MKATLEDLYQELWLRNRNNGNIKWETKDGRQISIKDMSDNHLINTIRMIERKQDLEELACEYEAYIEELED